MVTEIIIMNIYKHTIRLYRFSLTEIQLLKLKTFFRKLKFQAHIYLHTFDDKKSTRNQYCA